MRTGLKSLYSRKNPVRRAFSGTFRTLSIGAKGNRPAKLLLLVDVVVCEKGTRAAVADHIWIALPGSFVVPGFMPRDTTVAFTGIVGRYTRRAGKSSKIDYNIVDVEDVRLVRGQSQKPGFFEGGWD